MRSTWRSRTTGPGSGAANGSAGEAARGDATRGEAAAGGGSVPIAAMPDIVLMDIRMPGMGGVLATKAIKTKYPQLVVLILTTFDDDEFIVEALSHGASGYLLKDIDGGKLIESIREALSGNLLLTGKVAQKLASNIRSGQSAPPPERTGAIDELTQRELDIAALLVRGFNSAEIANKLYLTQGTVKNYLSSIYGKVGTNDRAKALLLLKERLG